MEGNTNLFEVEEEERVVLLKFEKREELLMFERWEGGK